MKTFLLYWPVCIFLFSLIYGCDSSNIEYFNYDHDTKRIIFKKSPNTDIFNFSLSIYWKDSLLCSPLIQYDQENKYYFIDAFPNKQIGGYYAKSYLPQICYEISKEKKINLRYHLTYKKRNKNLSIIDTTLTISNILDKDAVARFKKEYSYPKVNLEGTGFYYLGYTDYYAAIKGLLYSDGIKNVYNCILKEAAFHLNILLNQGYILYFIPNTAKFSSKIDSSLKIHIPTNITKAYLLLASLSGNKNASDFDFDTNKEISDFIAKEYSYNFPNATLNNSDYINIPIQKIGEHKYNFVQLLVVIYILNDNNYLTIPIGYTLLQNPLERELYYSEDGLFKSIVSPSANFRACVIDNFLIQYYAGTNLF